MKGDILVVPCVPTVERMLNRGTQDVSWDRQCPDKCEGGRSAANPGLRHREESTDWTKIEPVFFWPHWLPTDLQFDLYQNPTDLCKLLFMYRMYVNFSGLLLL